MSISSHKINNNTINNGTNNSANKSIANSNSNSESGNRINLADVYIDAANNGVKLHHDTPSSVGKKSIVPLTMLAKNKTSIPYSAKYQSKYVKFDVENEAEKLLSSAIYDVVSKNSLIKDIIDTKIINNNGGIDIKEIIHELVKNLYGDKKYNISKLLDGKLDKIFIKLLSKNLYTNKDIQEVDNSNLSLDNSQLLHTINLVSAGYISPDKILQMMLNSIISRLSEELGLLDDEVNNIIEPSPIDTDMPLLPNNHEKHAASIHAKPKNEDKSNEAKQFSGINLVQQLIEFINTEYTALQKAAEIQLALEKSNALMSKNNLEQSVKISQNSILSAQLNYTKLNTITKSQLIPNVSQASAEFSSSFGQFFIAGSSASSSGKYLSHLDFKSQSDANISTINNLISIHPELAHDAIEPNAEAMPIHEPYSGESKLCLQGVASGVIKLSGADKKDFLQRYVTGEWDEFGSSSGFLEQKSPNHNIDLLLHKVQSVSAQEKYGNAENIKDISAKLGAIFKDNKFDSLEPPNDPRITRNKMDKFIDIQKIISEASNVSESYARAINDTNRLQNERAQHIARAMPELIKIGVLTQNSGYEQAKNTTQGQYDVNRQINQATQEYVQEVNKNLEQDKNAADALNAQNNTIKDIIKNVAQSLVEYSRGK